MTGIQALHGKYTPSYVLDVLSAFDRQSLQLFPFGSRSMYYRELLNGNTPTLIYLSNATDYDYIAQDCPRIRRTISNAGFIEMNKTAVASVYSTPFDDTTTAIFSKAVLEPTRLIPTIQGKSYEIQISLRKNVNLVRAVWDSITVEYYYYNLWKSSPAFVMRNESKQHQKKYIRDQMNMLYAMANLAY